MIPIVRLSAVLLTLLAIPMSGSAQSGVHDAGTATSFLNFESPQVKPIDLASVGGMQVVLACNTPGNLIEVLDASDLSSLARVPVGQEPVSVVWVPSQSSFYTCNMVGDSLTRVILTSDGAGGVTPLVVATEFVGDEPMHLALVEGMSPATLAVSLQSSASVIYVNANDLEIRTALGQTELMNVGSTRILGHPRTVVADDTGGLLVLGGRGTRVSGGVGLDLVRMDSPGTATATAELSNLGTTPFNMDRLGDELWVVSGSAASIPPGEASARNAIHGFVQSWLHRVDLTTTSIDRSRNLNRDTTGLPMTQSQTCQPMDVVARPGAGGGADKVFVASYGTDRVIVVTDLDEVDPNDWSISSMEVAALRPGSDAIAGPRGLALGDDGQGVQALYVLNRIDASIYKFDAESHGILASTLLEHDPTPDYIRLGRRYLYDAKLSGSQFVSCASCHIDGRLDGVLWDLGDPTSMGGSQLNLFLSLIDGITDDITEELASGFRDDKDSMVTQSLQGLVNWEIGPELQAWVSNAPYHWRGDRETFLDFRGAFENLLGSPAVQVTQSDMEVFERFVNSITYPPNPEQELDRRYSGSMGPPFSNDPPSGPLWGLRVYHTIPLGSGNRAAGRSCVQCHSLPEGSNNRLTQELGVGANEDQPVESAAWRGLRQKELHHVRFSDQGQVVTSTPLQQTSGILHFGGNPTIDDFVDNFTDLGLANPGMVQFVRRFDTGTAPAVGRSICVRGQLSSEEAQLRDLFFEQADVGNVGLVAQVHFWNGDYEGYWYDPHLDTTGAPFVLEPGGATVSWADLISRIGVSSGDAAQITLACTPMGSERRLAHPEGNPQELTGLDPVVLALLPMAPNTAYEDVPLLRDNWDPSPEPTIPGGTRPKSFKWGGSPLPGQPDSTPDTLRITRMMQNALVSLGSLPYTRHDAPRRFLVRGKNIRHGALLEIAVGGLNGPVLQLPLFATGDPQRWTTAAELEPHVYYFMMLGGPLNPLAQRARMGDFPGEEVPAGTFSAMDNLHLVRVRNQDGDVSAWLQQALTLD